MRKLDYADRSLDPAHRKGAHKVTFDSIEVLATLVVVLVVVIGPIMYILLRLWAGDG